MFTQKILPSLFWIGLGFLSVHFLFQLDSPSYKQVRYDEIRDLVGAGRVESVVISHEDIRLIARAEHSGNRDMKEKGWQTIGGGDAKSLEDFLVEHQVKYEFLSSSSGFWVNFLGIFAPLLVIIFFFFYLSRRQSSQGAMETFLGKPNLVTKSGVKFCDVGGHTEVLDQLGDLVRYLQDPSVFSRMGASVPRGTLLTGPPGTGKTLIAKALAGEVGANFFEISGSAFVEMFVGVGARRARDLFETAKKAAPSVIFIDEIDAVGRRRTSTVMTGNDEREQTLNQLLVELDGFETNDGVIVVAATNRPDVLDPALLRPGRFDRQVMIPPPSLHDRKTILDIHSQKIPRDSNIDFGKIASLTTGLTGADLKNLVNEAALLATREGAELVNMSHFMRAFTLIVTGLPDKARCLSDSERRIVAVHESGHAIVHAATESAMNVARVSIIPTTSGALGYNLNTPGDAPETFLRTQRQILEMCGGLLGGRAAEEVMFGEVTTGARNDLQRVNQLLRSAIVDYGLGSGLFNQVFSETDWQSEAHRVQIEKEIADQLRHVYDWAKAVISLNKQLLEIMVDLLIEQEELSGDQLDQLLSQVRRMPLMSQPESIH